MNHSINFYPKLKTVLNGHWELINGLGFETIDKAAKLQATRGNDAARRFLEAQKSEAKS
jgi:hypothetical protein